MTRKLPQIIIIIIIIVIIMIIIRNSNAMLNALPVEAPVT